MDRFKAWLMQRNAPQVSGSAPVAVRSNQDPGEGDLRPGGGRGGPAAQAKRVNAARVTAAIHRVSSPDRRQEPSQAEEARSVITAEQIKEARRILGWSLSKLAEKAKLSPVTVQRAQEGERAVASGTAMTIQHAFEQAGLQFGEANGDGPGVRLRKAQ